MGVHNINSAEDFRQALADHKAVAVDFYATWCAPCKTIAPAFVQCSEQDKFKDVRFLKVDVDQLSDLAEELDIRAMPTFRLYLDEKNVGEMQGTNREALVVMLEKAL